MMNKWNKWMCVSINDKWMNINEWIWIWMNKWMNKWWIMNEWWMNKWW